jgi:hypothetical protein
LFEACPELRPVFDLLKQRPSQLHLYPNESYSDIARPVAEVAEEPVVVTDMEHLAASVYSMAVERVKELQSSATRHADDDEEEEAGVEREDDGGGDHPVADGSDSAAAAKRAKAFGHPAADGGSAGLSDSKAEVGAPAGAEEGGRGPEASTMETSTDNAADAEEPVAVLPAAEEEKAEAAQEAALTEDDILAMTVGPCVGVLGEECLLTRAGCFFSCRCRC